ncbi:MAG TPA: histone deacetylase, partial [bacterium]|nr:histone deacetylase [bacterium]
MPVTGLVADPVFMEHDTGPGHPERPERLEKIYALLDEKGLSAKALKIPLRPATAAELLAVHGKAHLERIAATAGREQVYLDGDTPTGPKSYHTALLAAGGMLNAVDAVMEGSVSNAFALFRPPGHHAERDRAMGFCLFNNVAVAAHHAMNQHGLKRVLIADWDLHHGNGTQSAFYPDPRVLYFSTHQFPYYPGSGGLDEIGSGAGQGFTVNVPLPAGCGDDVYESVFADVLEPVARGFKPELILVSAGFDIHRLDPLGGMKVTELGFARMAARLKGLAEQFCRGRLVAALEGGYHLDGLSRGVAAVVEVLMGLNTAPVTRPAPVDGLELLLEKVEE